MCVTRKPQRAPRQMVTAFMSQAVSSASGRDEERIPFRSGRASLTQQFENPGAPTRTAGRLHAHSLPLQTVTRYEEARVWRQYHLLALMVSLAVSYCLWGPVLMLSGTVSLAASNRHTAKVGTASDLARVKRTANTAD
jgi:hypothetical protein